jgi:serine/threonine-protein kinase RsbW
VKNGSWEPAASFGSVVEGERVRLTVAAEPELLRVARLTAAGLAGRMGFEVEEVEDLKIAVDEACFALMGTGRPGGELSLTYRPVSDGLAVDAVGEAGGGGLGELSAKILSAVVDEHSLTRTGDKVVFRLLKRRSLQPRV